MTTGQRAAAVAVATLCGCAASCDAGQEAATFSIAFAWQEPPDDAVWIWVRVEDRSRPDEASILASRGPVELRVGEPVDLSLDSVPNGSGRVVVVEVRDEPSPGLRVLYYGVSEPFSLTPGRHARVEVPLALVPPGADRHEAEVTLLFAGAERDAVRPDEIGDATVRVRFKEAVEILVANDPAMAAGLRSVSAEGEDGVSCADQADPEQPEHPFRVCRIEGWSLIEGVGSPDALDELMDGPYSVYVQLVDAQGYESEVRTATVLLDSQGPAVLSASVLPEQAIEAC